MTRNSRQVQQALDDSRCEARPNGTTGTRTRMRRSHASALVVSPRGSTATVERGPVRLFSSLLLMRVISPTT